MIKVFRHTTQAFALSALTALALTLSPATSLADQVGIVQAEQATLSKATVRYLRARRHLTEAIREFDKANTFVDPSDIINSDKFRSSLVQRVKELDVILAPQARKSSDSIRLEGDPAFIQR